MECMGHLLIIALECHDDGLKEVIGTLKELGEKSDVYGGQPSLVLHCLPHISHGLLWNLSQVSVVRSLHEIA
jgi:hypothetical protein